MLDSLHIENMAVISSLDVDFSKGLSVITGETGSGKSVMIDSLAFLLGGKPARELVRTGEQQATVSGVFTDLSEDCLRYLRETGLDVEDELLLQRTLSADGKVKNRLNGRVIPQSMLRELSGFLVSIHGQNDNQLLLRREVQARLLDSVCDLDDVITPYTAVYAELRRAKEALSALNRDSAEANRLRDILSFQIGEIDVAHLKNGEEEELLARRVKLQNAEKIAKQAEFTYHVLYGSEKGSAALILERAAQSMRQLASVIPEAEEAAERLMSMRYEAEDIANTARDFAEGTEGDPTTALNKVEGRLDAISKLRRKYGENIEAILAFRQEAAKKLSALEHSDEEEERLSGEIKELEKKLRALALTMHERRCAAAKEIGEKVGAELVFLDMPSVRFEIAVIQGDTFTATGNDQVEFCIATNPGDPLAPLSKIASGGELARIMLALRSVLNDRDGVQTAVFDEVDTGISGKTARKIGIKLSEIGKNAQVICITHSAQIASLATAHYKIAKHEKDDRAFTVVQPLDENGRISEVARILGGLSVTKTQTDAAAEMIEEGKCYR
ncbi:MAG: DNA repair protein RecN [Clostridia bacterium]|nr:DNA repair protein RecN [Clostridia bacterium]MBQ8716760.1 DNA repair protein RecN [Clostridia bacterium]